MQATRSKQRTTNKKDAKSQSQALFSLQTPVHFTDTCSTFTHVSCSSCTPLHTLHVHILQSTSCLGNSQTPTWPSPNYRLRSCVFLMGGAQLTTQYIGWSVKTFVVQKLRFAYSCCLTVLGHISYECKWKTLRNSRVWPFLFLVIPRNSYNS